MPPIPVTLPPELEALARPAPAALSPATVRLDPATHAELEALRERLGGASRGALLRYLVGVGLAATREQLEPYEPVPRDRDAERARTEARRQAEGLGSRIHAHFAPLGRLESEH